MRTSLIQNNFFKISLFALVGSFIGISSAVAPMVLPFAILALVIGAIIFAIPIRLILSLLLFTIFIDVSPIALSGSYIRIYQLIFIIYLLKYLFMTAKTHYFPIKFPLFLSLFFWMVTFFLSFGHIISPKDFQVVLIGQVFLYLMYFVTFNHLYTYDQDKQISFIKTYINGGIIIAIIGLLEIPLLYTGILSSIHAQAIGIPRPSSLLREPDWYGAICMYISLFLFTFSIFKVQLFKRTNLWLLVSFIGMILSMTRASWVGFVAGALFLFFFLRIGKKIQLIKIGFVLSCLLVFLMGFMYLLTPNTTTNMINRINPLTSSQYDSGATNSRVASLQIMYHYIAIHPWTGNGVGSMNLISQDQSITSQYIIGDVNAGRGNANLFVTSLFDSGIIGTFFLALFLISYIFIMLQRYKKTQDKVILAFLVSFIGLFIDFMFNNGIRFGFFWIHIAISLAYAYKTKLDKG